MKKEKSLKSPLKSLFGVFLISILSIFVYFFFSSKASLITKTAEQTENLANLSSHIVLNQINKKRDFYFSSFFKNEIDYSNESIITIYNLINAIVEADSSIEEINIITFKNSEFYSLLSTSTSLGEIKKILPITTSFLESYKTGINSINVNISFTEEGKDIKEIRPIIFPVKQNEVTYFAIEIKLKADSLFSIIKEDFLGNLLAIFIILTICISLALFFIRRIVKGENKIKEELNNSNLLLSEKNREIIASISYAKRIQEAYLPPYNIFKHYFPESFLIFKPKDIVSGDFYWFFSPKDKRDKVIYVAAADCTGHGVPGAIMSVICCDALNEAVIDLGITQTNLILDKARELVIQNLKSSKEGNQKDGMDITFCKIDKESQTIEFSAANNPLWLLRNGEIQEFKADKQPVGIHHKMEPFSKSVINYQQGDIIYLSSDGYADQFGGEKNKKFKSSNMKKIILSIANETMDKQGNIMSEQFEDWKGNNEQIDDVCVLGIKF